ncbi:MAG: ComF family protein [Candidatus Zambryskibacteria bacterium]|nr:ComF family protein [Candidatus Zambryskibacteria bacterium]
MPFLSRIRDLFIDFLFPKSERIVKLEALSADILLQTLPPAEKLKDGQTLALFDYEHLTVKEIVWEIKYSGNLLITKKIGEILYDRIRQEVTDLALFERWEKLILVPIPISDKRRFERGWNQTELLAREIMAHDREKMLKYLPRQLVKHRHTESQTKTTSRNERLKNLADSMKVSNPSSVTNSCVIVLDDVTTTGATFAEARRALRAGGAKKILCIAVAH